ncbi:MAG: glycosyltransferase family 4 protein [Opitutales bacterium]
MSRLIFINRFYWPDEPATSQLLTDLAESLAAAGAEVVVLASRPSGVGSPRKERRHGVHIRRLGATRFGARNLAARLVDFASFLGGVCWHLFWRVRRTDTVVLMTDPPLLGVVVPTLLMGRGIRCVHWVQDIYPEIAMEVSGQRWLAVLRPWRNFAWRRAHACVTLGTDMASVVVRAGVSPERVKIIPNWAPAGLEPAPSEAVSQLRHEWGLEGKFIALYSGNLGRVHDLDPVIELAVRCRDEPQVVFLFIGRGAQLPALQAIARREALTNVHFEPPQPRARLAPALALGDVHFVTLRSHCAAYVFPSKLYGIAAAGRPVIFVGPTGSEVAQQTAAAGFGLCFDRADQAGLGQALRRLHDDSEYRRQLGDAALRFARTHDLAGATAAWRQILPTDAALAAPDGRPQP